MTIKEEIMAMPVSQAVRLKVKYRHYGFKTSIRVGKIESICPDGVRVFRQNDSCISFCKYEDIKEIVR